VLIKLANLSWVLLWFAKLKVWPSLFVGVYEVMLFLDLDQDLFKDLFAVQCFFEIDLW